MTKATEDLVDPADAAEGIVVGAWIQFSDMSDWSSDININFAGDTLTEELTSQPNWGNFAGKRGVIELAVRECDEDDDEDDDSWLVYYVRMPCGSLVGATSVWLEALSPLHQLAMQEGGDCDEL